VWFTSLIAIGVAALSAWIAYRSFRISEKAVLIQSRPALAITVEVQLQAQDSPEENRQRLLRAKPSEKFLGLCIHNAGNGPAILDKLFMNKDFECDSFEQAHLVPGIPVFFPCRGLYELAIVNNVLNSVECYITYNDIHATAYRQYFKIKFDFMTVVPGKCEELGKSHDQQHGEFRGHP
jgi:hypothetical protein